ncbi:hypothetical protein ABXV23_10890 [Vibrio owensii]|uniref:hypothetical protein n=1 Tax=Vibrio owensii TaxID=696485 RepID=UPI003399AA97
MSFIENRHVMAKTSSSKCNIDCHYCFYLEKHHLDPDQGASSFMSEETLESYIQQPLRCSKVSKSSLLGKVVNQRYLGWNFL